MNYSNALPDASHDESQSSQILDFILGGHTALPDGTKIGPLTSTNRENASADNRQAGGASGGEVSSCPSGSSGSSSFSRYHFHGLANTQTQQTQQSQFTADDSYVVEDESSQKENTPTIVPPIKSVTAITTAAEACNRHEASLTPPPPLKSSNIGPVTPQQPLPLTDRVPPAQAAKVVKFGSTPKRPDPPVFKTPALPKEMPFSFKRKRSPSPSSQDSFAAAPSYENPEVYLANAKQFDRPLDQLGLDSQENSQSSITNQSRPEQASVDDKPGTAAMRSPSEITPYSLSSASVAVSGRVLVENSDESSRSNTQESTESAAANRSDSSDGPGDLGELNFSQQPTQVVGTSTISRSSLSSSLYVQHALEASSRAFDDSSQPQPTREPVVESQPATQEDDPSEAAASLVAESVVSDKRHILNLVPPEKRHRYMKEGANFTPRIDQERAAESAVASSSRFRVPNPVPTRETDDIDVVPDSEPQINVNESPLKSTAPTSSNVESSREEVIPPTPSEPTASVLEERNQTVPIQPPQREEEEEQEVAEARGESDDKVAEVVDEDVDEDVEEVQEEEVVAPKATKGRKPALGMKGKARKSAPRSRNAAKKSADTYKPTSAAKRGQGKKASTSKRPLEDDVQETPPRLIRKQPARATATSAKGKGKAPARVSSAPSGRGTPVTSNAPHTPVSGPSGVERDESPEIPLAAGKRDEEVATVLDEDEEMSVDVKQEPTGTSKKRRRTGSTAKQARPSRSMITRADSMSAPPSKRIKITTPMVCVALWKSPVYYYFGDVVGLDTNNPNKVRVHFHDDTEDIIDISKLRRGEPRIGDSCICNLGTGKAKARIVEIERWERDRMLRIEFLDGDEDEEMDVMSKDLKFHPRTIECSWKDRLLKPQDIVAGLGGKDRSPSKMSFVSSGEAKNHKLLHKTAVAVTLPGVLLEQRGNYERAVAALGGTVIEWAEAYAFQGKVAAGGKRWYMRPEDVKFVGKGGITRLFLLSDAPCNRPKFLLALALGIPCVNFTWLEALGSSTEEVDWLNYLLPAGVSGTLSTRVSQLVDLDWGGCLEHITEIMSSPVPAKVYRNMSILCLDADFVSKKGSDKDFLDGSYVIPRVILCMGAAYVEAVANPSHASKALKDFDYIVLKDGTAFPLSNGEKYVDVTWVKDCLISSRLFPPPEQNLPRSLQDTSV